MTDNATDRIIEYTTERLYNWYANAKKDYGIIGGGVVKEVGNEIVIHYLEDDKSGSYGVNKTTLAEEKIDYLFNTWMEA